MGISQNENSIEMILKRKLMFYIEDGYTEPITVDTGISLKRINNESNMEYVKIFIDEFNKKYSDATYVISNTGDAFNSPNLMILVTPTP